MYIWSILKCCISSSNEITPNIKKSSSIVERHIAGVVNVIARSSLSPNWCIQYSWKKLSPMKSQTVPYLHRCCVYHRLTVFLYFIIHINPLYIWMMFSDWVIKGVLFYHSLFFPPSNTPSREHLSFGILHSVYVSILSIYWKMAFTSYYYWGNTCRMTRIDVNENKTRQG